MYTELTRLLWPRRREPVKQFVVLVQTEADWPDVVYVGSWEGAAEFARALDDYSTSSYPTSIQAVVKLDEIEEYRHECS